MPFIYKALGSISRTIPSKNKHTAMPGMAAHTFNPSTEEAEADTSLSSRTAWAI